ncbi:MAG TPA: hypothetical protein VLQ67_01440, partial [Arachnia sp.]|nr:hypothetical protein [Arachnia sp.]
PITGVLWLADGMICMKLRPTEIPSTTPATSITAPTASRMGPSLLRGFPGGCQPSGCPGH